MRALRKSFVALITAVFLAALMSPADASLVLRQNALELNLKQGQAFRGGVVLENVSDTELDVKAAVSGAGKWVELDEGMVTIPARSIKDLKFTASVPAGAKGGHYSSFLFTYGAGKVPGPEGEDVNLNMIIEMPIRISVEGTVKKAVTVERFDAAVNGGRLEIAAKIRNSGNVFTEVRPRLLMLDEKGSVAEAKAAEVLYMYPGDEKEFTYGGESKTPKGTGKIIGFFDFDVDNPVVVERSI